MLTSKCASRRLKRQLRLVTCCIFLGLLFARTIRDRRDAVTRESSIDFSSLHELTKHSPALPDEPVRQIEGRYIDKRYEYRRTLKAGNQGSVYLYQDGSTVPPMPVIVKTISIVSRNTLPPDLRPAFANFTTRWPSELDGSLSIAASLPDESSPFVPVHDYFILRKEPFVSDDWSWTIVTPYIPGGTLTALASAIRGNVSTDHVDHTYRPAFNDLFSGLQSLHQKGFCHDDVKPQNIFVETPQRWLLGDLGNARQINHPYHSTHFWKRKNQWPNCELNDTRRLLKSYLSFLRMATGDREQFDLDFLAASAEWSRMYWSFVEDSFDWSSTYSRDYILRDSGRNASAIWNDGPPKWFSGLVDRSLRAVTVKQELFCSALWWKLWLTF